MTMKIQCDVCETDEAAVFCIADEAALCSACDRRVHHANKLAGKHQRYSLHHHPSKQAPFCDVCQDSRAFLFCHQDRALLCRECDFQTHKVNEHTQKHTRFLLTGVKLSSAAAHYSDSQSSSASQPSDVVPNITSEENTPSSCKSAAPAPSDNGWSQASTMSEYLIEMLPGWHVDDFLDSSFQSHGFCKSGGHDLMPLWDADILQSNTMKMGTWANSPLIQPQNQSMDIAFRAPYENNKTNRQVSEDGSFLVPQIMPSSSGSKRFISSR